MHRCGPSVAAGFGDIRVPQESHGDAPRDPTTIRTPGTGCLGMNDCIKSMQGTSWALCVCQLPCVHAGGQQTLALNGIFLCPSPKSVSLEKRGWWSLWVCISFIPGQTHPSNSDSKAQPSLREQDRWADSMCRENVPSMDTAARTWAQTFPRSSWLCSKRRFSPVLSLKKVKPSPYVDDRANQAERGHLWSTVCLQGARCQPQTPQQRSPTRHLSGQTHLHPRGGQGTE